MRIARPWSLELEYTRDLLFPLLLRGDGTWPRTVLQVGLGAASITRFLYRHFPETKVTVVEIDPLVVVAAYQYFRMPEESARLRIVEGDAAEFVATKDRRYDLIVVDGYDAKGRPGMLDTEPFYLNCARRLGLQGCEEWVIGRPAVHPMKNLCEYMQAADVTVQASLAEGGGMSPLEALSCGTPVVATRVGGMALTLPGIAQLIPPGDAVAMAEAFRWVRDNPEAAREQALRGRDYVGTTWSRVRAFEAISAALEESGG